MEVIFTDQAGELCLYQGNNQHLPDSVSSRKRRVAVVMTGHVWHGHDTPLLSIFTGNFADAYMDARVQTWG